MNEDRQYRLDIIVGSASLFVAGLLTVDSPMGMYTPASLITVYGAFAAWVVVGNNDSAGLIGMAIAATIVPILFYVASRSVRRANNFLPNVTKWAFVACFMPSVSFAAYGAGLTLEYYGWGPMIALLAQAVLPPILLICVWLQVRNRLSLETSLRMHWFGFLWLSWSAFPWWGERL